MITTLAHEHGTGTVAVAAATMKKKAPTKKRITNSNTPKQVNQYELYILLTIYIYRNLCARDWVPAVGGTTEEFDRYWDVLPEEDKKVCIHISAVRNNLTGF
jgi:hypothetical protein